MRLLTTSDFCKKEYGEKLYKLSISGGFTCPNRDGRCGTRGCIFCSEGGSGDFAASADMPLEEQIEYAKNKVSGKFTGSRYIAYFQAYTNTYAPLKKLKETYDPLLDREDIRVISIATRPDCLPEDVIEYLSELNRVKPLWVELGLQTTKEESIKYIRRGYPTEVYDRAIRRLNDEGIHTVTHIILGLPGETRADMIESVRHAAGCGTKGIKLQLLHVLKNTDLAEDYAKGLFKTLEEDEYFSVLKDCLAQLPDGTVIHRLTGDGPKNLLIAPLWSANKKEVINRVNELINKRGLL